MTLATWHTRGRILINTFLTQKLHQVAIVCAAACFALATPAVQAAETSADAGIIAPDEPDDDSFTAGIPVSYTHLRAHETVLDLVCRLLLEKKKI